MRPYDDELDERHKKLFKNFDKIKPEDSDDDEAKDGHGDIHKVVRHNGMLATFSPHFMSRMDHKSEHTGDDMEHDKYNPHRRISAATKQLVPHSSVKVHVKKILKHVEDSAATDAHMPSKKNPTTAVMYKHKPTGQDILVHLHHNPSGGKPRVQFQTYAGSEPFRAFANKNRPNNDKSTKPRTETRIDLQSVIYDKLVDVLYEETECIHRVTLD